MYLPVDAEDVFATVEEESDEEWTTENDEVLQGATGEEEVGGDVDSDWVPRELESSTYIVRVESIAEVVYRSLEDDTMEEFLEIFKDTTTEEETAIDQVDVVEDKGNRAAILRK